MEKGAFGLIDGERVLILRTRLLAASDRFLLVEPGTVLDRGSDQIVVQCGDTPIAVIEWSPVSTFK